MNKRLLQQKKPECNTSDWAGIWVTAENSQKLLLLLFFLCNFTDKQDLSKALLAVASFLPRTKWSCCPFFQDILLPSHSSLDLISIFSGLYNDKFSSWSVLMEAVWGDNASSSSSFQKEALIRTQESCNSLVQIHFCILPFSLSFLAVIRIQILLFPLIFMNLI